jgi:hypothetical protein
VDAHGQQRAGRVAKGDIDGGVHVVPPGGGFVSMSGL